MLVILRGYERKRVNDPEVDVKHQVQDEKMRNSLKTTVMSTLFYQSAQNRMRRDHVGVWIVNVVGGFGEDYYGGMGSMLYGCASRHS